MNIKYESFDFEVNSLDIQYAQLKICEHYDLGRPDKFDKVNMNAVQIISNFSSIYRTSKHTFASRAF